MWSDNETDQDLLGFDVHAGLLQAIVADSENLPVTVGLFGDWGSGKSSVLKILKRNLSASASKKNHLVIHFDSWIFEGYEDAKTAILSSILDELSSNTKLSAKVKDEAKSLLRRVRWMKVAKLGLQAAASVALSNPLPLMAGLVATKCSSEGENESENQLSDFIDPKEDISYDVRRFREEFSAMIGKTDFESVIVLVDDLDRCSPERIIDNLEAIKLFLNVPGMAFVIAADRRIVEDAIRVRYSNFLNSGSLGAHERQAIVVDYLEKLIQIPYTLPKLSPNEIRHYLSLLLIKKIVPDQFASVIDDYRTFLMKKRHERYDVYGKLNLASDDERKPELDRHLNLIESASDPITEGLKGNPRQVKRFLNSLWIRQRLAEVSNIKDLDHSVLIKLMVLEYINLELFGHLYKLHKESSDGTVAIFEAIEADIDQAISEESNKKWADPSIVRWLKAAPKLAHVDLRDYFWVSRSALDDSYVGIRMLSQAVRRCLERFLSGTKPSREEAGQLFLTLDSPEMQQVITSLQRSALLKPEDSIPAEALFFLADNLESVSAAEALGLFYERTDMDKASIKLVNALVSVKEKAHDQANKRLIYVRDSVKDKNGKFSTALNRALKGRKA